MAVEPHVKHLARDCDNCGWRNYPQPAPSAASTAPSMRVVWLVDRCDACGWVLEPATPFTHRN